MFDAAFRQFDPAAPHPCVRSVDEVRSEWASVAARPAGGEYWAGIPHQPPAGPSLPA